MDSEKPLILLVDDDNDDLEVLQETIAKINPVIKCETAKNGFDALIALDKLVQLPRIIFLDVNMPRMNGKECLTKIRSNPKLTDLPIIMYSTAFDEEFLKTKGPNLMFMEKQTSMHVMLNEIREVVERFFPYDE